VADTDMNFWSKIYSCHQAVTTLGKYRNLLESNKIREFSTHGPSQARFTAKVLEKFSLNARDLCKPEFTVHMKWPTEWMKLPENVEFLWIPNLLEKFFH
jgi:hypothetical protein